MFIEIRIDSKGFSEGVRKMAEEKYFMAMDHISKVNFEMIRHAGLEKPHIKMKLE